MIFIILHYMYGAFSLIKKLKQLKKIEKSQKDHSYTNTYDLHAAKQTHRHVDTKCDQVCEIVLSDR